MKKNFSNDYKNGEEEACRIIGSNFKDWGQLKALIDSPSRTTFSATIIELLQSQNKISRNPQTLAAQIAKLQDPRCVTVTTGQQCGLFLGPLFTFYKAASTIRLAREIEERFEVPCVPIFWLQSEDHDFEEIRSINVLTQNQDAKRVCLALLPEEEHNRKSVGALKTDARIEAALLQLKASIEPTDFSEQLFAELSSNYQTGTSYSTAFASSLRSIFSSHGLLTFDVREASNLSQLQSIMLKSLEERASISSLLIEQQRLLESKAYDSQVHVRENSPLFFFHPEGPGGSRYRLEEQASGKFSAIGLDGSFTISEEELKKSISSGASHFSSSALLRPIIQDTLLPNVASILGPAELNYSAQITPLYEVFSLRRPLQVPRPQFQLIEHKQARLLDKLSLEAASFWDGRESVEERVRKGLDIGKRIDSSESSSIDSIEQTLVRLETLAKELDPTLEKPVSKTKAKMLSSLGPLFERFRKAALRNDSITKERLDKLEENLIPEGTEQERYYAAVSFFARYGDMLLAKLIAESSPLEPVKKDVFL